MDKNLPPSRVPGKKYLPKTKRPGKPGHNAVLIK